MGITPSSLASLVAQSLLLQIEANPNAASQLAQSLLEEFGAAGQPDAPAQDAAPAPETADPAASMANLRSLQAEPSIAAQLTPAPTQNAAQQWLAQNPGASAQDIINWGYANGGNTYAGAAQFLKQFGIDINQLVANRQAPASGIVNGSSSSGGGGDGQIQPTPGGGATGGSVQATPQMQALANNSRQVAAELGTTGWCARGVEMALSRTYGLNISGNGNDVDNELQKNGWKKVDMSLEDALKVPGLVLVWEKTSTTEGSKYGHTAITQGDGHSSSSDFVENDTLAGSGGRTGLSIWAPPDAAVGPGSPSGPSPTPETTGGGGAPASGYTVKSGDTLWDIAKARGISLQSLIAANPQISNPDLIYPGQNINIPGGGSSPAPVSPSSSAGPVVGIENNPGANGNAQQVIKFFMDKGLTREQAAGIAANIQSESNFNPDAVGDGGTSFGICQWHNNRGDNMKAWTQANGYASNSFQGQLEFLWHEMNTSYSGVLNQIKGAGSAYDAAYIFCTQFEVPANKEQVGATRGNLAEQILA